MLRKQYSQSEQGFTLLEILVVVLIIGVLSAIAVPSWLAFLRRQQLNKAQDKVHRALQSAQSEAKRDKVSWQVSFRQVMKDGKKVVEWAVHPADEEEFISEEVRNNEGRWQELGSQILLDVSKNDRGKYETSVFAEKNRYGKGPWRILFNHHGCAVYKPEDECGQTSLRALGRITLRTRDSSKLRRCVVVSTVLGKTREGKEHDKPDSTNKYCY